MSDKKLKVVDLENLPPKSSPELQLKKHQQEIPQPDSIARAKKLLNTKLEYGTYQYNYWGILTSISILILGFVYDFKTIHGWVSHGLSSKGILLGTLQEIFLHFTNEMWLLVVIIFAVLPLIIIKVKRKSPKRVELTYEGLNLPVELFPPGPYVRKKVYWREIKAVKKCYHRGVEYIQLLNENQRPIAELPLNLRSKKKMYEKMDILVPKDSPLRIIFNKSNKN